jgi:hypothetical protein
VVEMMMLKIINDRAMKNYDFTKYKQDEWVQHWFDTAEQIKQEFATEGLAHTVEHIDEIIAQQKSFFPQKSNEVKQDESFTQIF